MLKLKAGSCCRQKLKTGRWTWVGHLLFLLLLLPFFFYFVYRKREENKWVGIDNIIKRWRREKPCPWAKRRRRRLFLLFYLFFSSFLLGLSNLNERLAHAHVLDQHFLREKRERCAHSAHPWPHPLSSVLYGACLKLADEELRRRDVNAR